MPRGIHWFLFELELYKPKTTPLLVVPLNTERQSVNGLTKVVRPKCFVIDLRVTDWLTF